MHIPLYDAVGIMRVAGSNFGCTSAAMFTESKSSCNKIIVEIRGTSLQLVAAQQLIQAKIGPGRVSFGPFRRVVDKVAQTMKISLADAVGIIGVGGSNFGCTNGAIFILLDTPISRKRIRIEIRGTSSQVQTAQQFIQAKIGRGQACFEPARPVVDQALTCATLPPPHVAAGPSGEVTHQPPPLVPPSAKTSPPSAATKAPVDPQTEVMVVEVPQLPSELPQNGVDQGLTGPEPEPGEITDDPQALVLPSSETSPSSAATEAPVGPQKEPIMCSSASLVQVPPELPQLQPATASVALEVPPELPAASALEAIETKAEVPVVVSGDEVAMQMEVEESVVRFRQRLAFSGPGKHQDGPAVLNMPTFYPPDHTAPGFFRTGPDRAFSLPPRNFFGHRLLFPRSERPIFGPGKGQYGTGVFNMPTFYPPDHTAPGFFRTSIDQALTGPSVHLYKDLPPSPCHRCRNQSRQRPMSPPPHVTAAPSGLENINETKRSRVSWENMNLVKTFLDACIHEIAINGRENGSLKAMSWKKVGEILKDRHNFSIDHKQMKNYFDRLNTKYKAWVSLKNKTPNIYDPSTNTFNLTPTDKEWEAEIKKNQCIETLVTRPLPFPNLCEQLFDGAISTDGFFQNGVDQALTGPERGEITDEPQALVPPSAEMSPPSAATEAPVEPQKEPIMCSSASLVQVPSELRQLQPGTSFMEIETEAEASPELTHVQPASEVVAIDAKRPMSVFEEEILGVLKMIVDKMNKPEPPPKPSSKIVKTS